MISLRSDESIWPLFLSHKNMTIKYRRLTFCQPKQNVAYLPMSTYYILSWCSIFFCIETWNPVLRGKNIVLAGHRRCQGGESPSVHAHINKNTYKYVKMQYILRLQRGPRSLLLFLDGWCFHSPMCVCVVYMRAREELVKSNLNRFRYDLLAVSLGENIEFASRYLTCY